MDGKIFINYRRDDSEAWTGRLGDRLREVFKPDQVFMDVDSIAPGLDFVTVLDEQVAQCDVMLVIIGKGWIDARDASGALRLNNADDFVRIEIESALKRQKRVIPVLVGGATLPPAASLPEEIRPLIRRNAVRLTHERFRSDTQGLINAVQKALDEAEKEKRREKETVRHPEFYMPELSFQPPLSRKRGGSFGWVIGGVPFAAFLVWLALGIFVGSDQDMEPIQQGAKIFHGYLKCRYLEFIGDFPFVGIQERLSTSTSCSPTDPTRKLPGQAPDQTGSTEQKAGQGPA